MAKNNEFEDDETGSSAIGWGDETSDDQGTGSSTGGSTDAIEFRYRDAMAIGPRDDMLPAAEIKRLLTVHEDLHKQLVTKAKDLIAERKARKEGKHTVAYHNQATLQGLAAGQKSRYKKHPISDKFSGLRDDKMPDEFIANTNEELADRLENRLQNRLALSNRPTNTPTLRRT